MSEINKAIRGTGDVLPDQSYKWQFIENKMIETARLFGFKEIRIPVFEHTEVFTRSVGDTTDVVQKEMYTFEDKSGRSITLRPEFTAGVVRSVIEHGLVNCALPVKTCYVGACYRYEKPQAGRLREFHQFGVECFGASKPTADAEIITLANTILENIGIKNLSLEINSIGCPECRKVYHAALKEYLNSHSEELCDTCKGRLERNPMRVLDCKSPICSKIASAAPVMLDYLCNDCKEHFDGVKAHLSAADIDYKINTHIVRGLDYYTRTVFEFVSGDIGAQSTVCGGGRYDGLVGQMGGPQLPSLGFAMGLERLLMVMESQNVEFKPEQPCDVFIASMGEKAEIEATKLCCMLRDEGFCAVTDITSRGLKAQMKYANKIGATFSAVIGDNELMHGSCNLKNMETGEERQVTLPDGLVEAVYDFQINSVFEDLSDSVEGIETLFQNK
ncbi:MAG: histidine--tRNA ligase [Oscillospiraceae bacterium]|nr:histidine--tRNA ligase [Oscillospiraceae bacterium]